MIFQPQQSQSENIVGAEMIRATLGPRRPKVDFAEKTKIFLYK